MSITPKTGDLVSFYNYDTGDFSTGVVIACEDYNYTPSQPKLASVPSIRILSEGRTHVVPAKDEFWNVEVLIADVDMQRRYA